MPCYQSTNLPSGITTTGRTSYATEADCLAACKEGACCEGTTCSIKPQCQCQGTGKTFKGVGTVCEPNPCLCCCRGGITLTHTSKQACESANGKWGACNSVGGAPRQVLVTLNLQDDGDNKWSRINGVHVLVKQEIGNINWHTGFLTDPYIKVKISGSSLREEESLCFSECAQTFVSGLVVSANRSIRDVPRNDWSPVLVLILMTDLIEFPGLCANSTGIVRPAFTLGNPLP